MTPRSPDDPLTAQDIIREYGTHPTVVESMLRNLGKRDLIFRIDEFIG